MNRVAVTMVASLVLAGLVACEPQNPGGTPSACAATIAGSARDGELASGRDRATLSFPEGAEVSITGTVTNVASLFGADLPWELAPLISGITGDGETTSVDDTWVNGGETRDIEVVFRDKALFGKAYDWNLKLATSGAGCPSPTPEACEKAGGNVFHQEPVVIDGEQRQGCYDYGESCLSDVPTDLSETECSEDDVLAELAALDPGGLSILLLAGGRAIAVTGGSAAVGAPVGAGVIAALATVALVGATVVVAVVVYDQAKDTIEELQDAIDGVLDRNPDLANKNPGSSSSPDFALAIKIAMATCTSEIAIDLVIDNADKFGLAGDAIDAATGLVDMPGGERRHLCELIPVYAPGGSTQKNAKPTVEASLHVRDVLYGEQNRPETYPTRPDAEPNPPLPQPQWQILTRATNPDDTTNRNWYKNAPYFCKGNQPANTECDEWPWYRTAEGGPEAHLRIINGDDNGNGGSDYLSFLTGCGLNAGDSFAVTPLPPVYIEGGARSKRLC